jgi:hypothetical protein
VDKVCEAVEERMRSRRRKRVQRWHGRVGGGSYGDEAYLSGSSGPGRRSGRNDQVRSEHGERLSTWVDCYGDEGCRIAFRLNG